MFVPLVEQGWVNGPIAEQIVDAYLRPLREQPPDAVILGCTHYPLLQETLQAYLPPAVQIVDSAEACAQAVGEYLTLHGLTASPGNGGHHQYFVTDMPASFFTLANRFLGQPVQFVDKVNL
jgi:glutamate racemase